MKKLILGDLVLDKHSKKSGIITKINSDKYTQYRYTVSFINSCYLRRRSDLLKVLQ